MLEDNLRTPSGLRLRATARARSWTARCRSTRRRRARRAALDDAPGAALRGARAGRRRRPVDRAAHRRARQQRLVGAPAAGAPARGPARDPARRSTPRRPAARAGRRPRACPSTSSTAAPTRTACATSDGRLTWRRRALLGPCAAGALAVVNALRHRRRRRQARARLRRGDGPLLPRRGAAAARRCRRTTSASPSVATRRSSALDELVVKPRAATAATAWSSARTRAADAGRDVPRG